MPTLANIGQELAEVPVASLIAQMAIGIADGQRALDLTSIQSLIELSKTPVSIIPEVTEVITPEPYQVDVEGKAPIMVTGARVAASAAEPVQMTALQAGILPTFYQFTEATIELRLSVQVKQVTTSEEEGTRQTFWLFGSSVNFKTQNTYSYTAEASSSIVATIKPVPPPSRIMPSTVTVNMLGPAPNVTVHG